MEAIRAAMKVAMLLLEVAAVEEGGEGKEKSKEG